MVTAKGQSIVPSVSTGHCVKITNMGDFNQQFWVTKVVHRIDESGKYHNKFKCVPLDVAYPTDQAIAAKTLAKIQRAKVVRNDDPDGLGRILIQFLWSEDVEIWVRYVSPHAGDDRGFYCLPEIEDEVLVAFEEGDPDRPVVIGSLYNKTQIAPVDTVNDENNIKLLKTRSGNLIKFTDEDGGEKIEISQSDGTNAITMDLSGPSITITSDGGDISLEANNITLKADSAITIESGADLKVDAGTNMELTAAATAKLEATATLDVKGATINLN